MTLLVVQQKDKTTIAPCRHQKLLWCCLASHAIGFIAGIFVLWHIFMNSNDLQPYQSLSPKIADELRTFEPNLEYENLHNGIKYSPDNTWEGSVPGGAGFVVVKQPKKWGLSRGYLSTIESLPGAKIYSISMFHQLHCLSSFKSTLRKLNEKIEASRVERVSLNDLHLDHAGHCLEYLRQAIICHGDTTLEKAHSKNETKYGHNKLGWGDVDQCRNYDTILEFAMENSINNWFSGYGKGLAKLPLYNSGTND